MLKGALFLLAELIFLSVVTADQHMTKEQAQCEGLSFDPETAENTASGTNCYADRCPTGAVPWWGQTKVLGAVHFRWAVMTEPVGISHSYSVFGCLLQCRHGCNLFYPSVELHPAPTKVSDSFLMFWTSCSILCCEKGPTRGQSST